MNSRRPYVDETVDVDDTTPAQPVIDEKSDSKKDAHQVNAVVNNLAEKLADDEDGAAPIDDVEYVMDKVEMLTVEESRDILEKLLKDHEYDYNFSENDRRKIRALLDGPLETQSVEEWQGRIKTEAAVNKFFSPYPEVRSITTPTDDTNIPAETIRAHLLGYFWAILSQFTNSLFTSRFPAISVSSSVVQILLYPCGVFLARVLPDWGIKIAGKRHSLNPGPWSYKEQMLSTIIVDVGISTAYCFWNIQTQTIYYKDEWLTPAYCILLLLSTQLMGLGFSGLLRRFVIYPVDALWPSILPTLALNRALLLPEKKETIHGWNMSRYKFFFVFFTIAAVYFWLPDFIFPALSMFAWMTWIAPNNFNVNTITGSLSGMGYNPISSFDWNTLSTYTAPLSYPFFVTLQQYIGTFLGGLIIIAFYYSNVKWTAYLPINSSGIFDNTGNPYNISKVINPGSGIMNEDAYKAYSPAFYSAANLLAYGCFFAFYPLTMVFIIFDMWRPIAKAFRSIGSDAIAKVKSIVHGVKRAVFSLRRGNVREAWQHLRMIEEGSSIYDGFDDPLTNLMRQYPEVPDWWFFIIAIVAFIFAIIIIKTWPQLDTPVWTVFFVVGLNLVFLVPMTYLYAISGTTVGLNVVTELVVGYALPGRPEALMFVKAYGYNINGQADNYISDQKMGFYAKLPPRAMYRGQVISAIITAFVCYGVVQFVDNEIPGICTPNQPSHFTCAAGSKGAIGPKRIFGQMYPALQYCFLIGFLLAIVWILVKRFGSRVQRASEAILPAAIFKPLDVLVFTPISWLKHVHPSLLLTGMLSWAPTNLTYFTGGLYISAFFMYYLKRYKTTWWEKYNYVLSAALTGGVAFSGIIIFFAVQYHPVNLDWWGVNIQSETIDGGAGQQALLTDLPAKGFFGPDTWF
ncbi:hypothetical protein E4U42_001805 [Claviceps africana]|uniref:Oligopeptide transporter protein n=1 Tax=Claviceps africana TaxID=83212 RepID=A0A8K0NJ11_9HYPO|nr:hypothetical protein E4U42_001805 [Claviceps africana]